MQPLETIISRAKRNIQTIVLPEGEDPRVIAASIRASRDGLCTPILLGEQGIIEKSLLEVGEELEGVTIVNPALSEKHALYANELLRLRKAKGMTIEKAMVAMNDPIAYGAMMVHMGDASGAVAGAVSPTADVLRAALQIIGRAEGVQLVSSFFLMLLCAPHHKKKGAILFSDCGLVVEPSSEELAQIAINTAASYRLLFDSEPKIAMLSFSTSGSARHPRVDNVVAATQLVKQQRPDLMIEGELQFDAAFVPEISAAKSASNELEGKANVMVFPNLEAANIGYKIAQRIGGALAVGPILQGLAQPMNDLSRGCTADDIYNLMAVTSLQVTGAET